MTIVHSVIAILSITFNMMHESLIQIINVAWPSWVDMAMALCSHPPKALLPKDEAWLYALVYRGHRNWSNGALGILYGGPRVPRGHWDPTISSKGCVAEGPERPRIAPGEPRGPRPRDSSFIQIRPEDRENLVSPGAPRPIPKYEGPNLIWGWSRSHRA